MVRFIKRWVLYNTGVKFASLLLAVALWLYLSIGEVAKRVFVVPISWENVPVNLEPSADYTRVSVATKGPRSLLFNIQGEDFFIPIDLSGREAGRYTHHLSCNTVRSPQGVEVLDVSPSRVTILLKRAKR